MWNAIQKRWVIMSVLGVFAIGLVLAAARFVAYPAVVSAPDHLHVVVTRIQSPSGGHTIIFARQFGGVAGKVYAQLVSGERIPENAILFFPFAGIPYNHYALTFSHAGIQTGVARSDAQGCQGIARNALGGGRDIYSW
jgi:hypothetical protein